MVNRLPIAPEEFYHIYNRGVDKRIIYKCDSDYRRFILLLFLCNGENPVNISDELEKGRTFSELFEIDRGEALVSIGAYVLMPNHFHILLKEKQEGGVSKFMRKVSTGYSMYFNKKYDRTGGLFEGRYKAKHVDSDEYLKYLFAYIHLNPVKLIESTWKDTGIQDKSTAEKYLADYRYSSYQDYININRKESGVLATEAFPDYFAERLSFRDYIDSWLNYTEEI